jgi:hypothetical protein
MPTGHEAFRPSTTPIQLLNKATGPFLPGDSPTPGSPTRASSPWTLQESEIERREHKDNSDVHYQPLQELVPEEQDVHADHDGYQRDHVKHDGCLSSHRSFLLGATGMEQERRWLVAMAPVEPCATGVAGEGLSGWLRWNSSIPRSVLAVAARS